MRSPLWLILSCLDGPGPTLRGPEDSDSTDTDAGDAPDLVAVGHEREFRAMWVATVANIDFPSAQRLSADAQKAELISILDTLAECRFNAIVFQVRPEGDALYDSDLEPWSRYLTGTQGQDPGYDPLAFLIEAAHARNIEVHAWFNPYRAKSGTGSASVAPHWSVTMPQFAYRYGGSVWMDPGAPPVQDHAALVIDDVVRRYDVDGIHFDDYFYPYPDGSTPFPDSATYAVYQKQGGTLDRDDWRRDNVNRLVERVSLAISARKPDVRFGISPFGIYRPGEPSGITGLDQYAKIYSDPVKWTQEGWLDYLAPQLYWPSTQTAHAYEPLLAWWAAQPQEGQYTFAGNYLSQLGSSGQWSVEEFRAQMALSRQHRDHGSAGNIFFSYKPLKQNRLEIRSFFRDEVYPKPALTPPIADLRGESVEPPGVDIDGNTLSLSHELGHGLRAWAVYVERGGAWELDRVVPVSQPHLKLPDGRYAISAVARSGVESLGLVVELP